MAETSTQAYLRQLVFSEIFGRRGGIMAAPIKSMSTPVLPTWKTFNTALPSFSLPNPLRKGPNIRSENAELQRKVEDATTHYQAKSQEVRETQARARAAEVEAEALRQMARRFWEEEWSNMRDFMMMFSKEEHVKEIEDRILAEYGELFEEKGRRMRDGGESETERAETVVSKLSSGSLPYVSQ